MEELLGVIEDLDKNIERIDSEIYASWKESGDVS